MVKYKCTACSDTDGCILIDKSNRLIFLPEICPYSNNSQLFPLPNWKLIKENKKDRPILYNFEEKFIGSIKRGKHV